MWSNGSTNQRDTGLLAGPYTCIITDDSGCKYEIGVILANPAPPQSYCCSGLRQFMYRNKRKSCSIWSEYI